MAHPSQKQVHDPYASLRIRDFSIYLAARFFMTLGVQIQGVVVGIQVYKLTHSAFQLGLIGLAEAIPFIGLSFFSGYVADIIRRKKIILASTTFLLLASWSLFFVSHNVALLHELGAWPIFGIIFCTGIARGFLGPVFPAFLSQLVPRKLYPNATTWQSNLWQTAAVLGPAMGGMLIGWESVIVAYGTCSSLITLSFFLMMLVTNHPLPPIEKKESLVKSLTAGFRFVFSNQVMLAAFSLDLFAVLFGGAVAMIPVFANEVLHAGKDADSIIGWLRAAPAIGAIVSGFLLARFPPTKHAGRNLFIAVIGFGCCIIGFALSDIFLLSFIFLLISGAFDQVSVVVRQSILQLLAPDNMRGRIAAVNGIFIGSSNEIGEFESGVTAKMMGNIPSVIFGGCMTIAIVIAVMFSAPKLRNLDLAKIT
ncbi:MAG TPA: MFS transporter [Bacteroidia bacterium]|nr:MFS transporter [Bacteroidia bacterium]